jgi:thiamine-monophosphate kinase
VPEFSLIRRLASLVPTSGADIECSIGDDGAVLCPDSGERLVVATDTLNEGTHFLPGADAGALGHKALAVNLSDLAAMGASPRWALLNLSLPREDAAWIEAFGSGFAGLAERTGVRLVGGDTCAGPLSLVVTVLGTQEPGRSLRRDGARPGDDVWVSGCLGDAALALERRLAGRPVEGRLAEALDAPEPRLALGRRLVGVAGACIDVSDGLLADLGHIATASGLGAVLTVADLPASPALAALEDDTRRWSLQLCGGDDYELCFTAPVAQRDTIRGIARDIDLRLTRVGSMEQGAAVRCRAPDGAAFRPARRAWEHFAGSDGG